MAIKDVQSPRPRVEITQEIIDQATPKNSGHCVIADAIAAKVPGASSVSVDLATVRWTDRAKGVRYIWLTPVSAQQLLLAFDAGLPIEPQTLRFGAAAQIIEIKASSRASAERTAARRQELEAKEAAGEALTSPERRTLSRSRADRAKMGGAGVEDRPVSEAPASLAYVGGQGKQTVKVGGKAPGSAVLAHGRGRRRQYGLRVAGVPDALLGD